MCVRGGNSAWGTLLKHGLQRIIMHTREVSGDVCRGLYENGRKRMIDNLRSVFSMRKLTLSLVSFVTTMRDLLASGISS